MSKIREEPRTTNIPADVARRHSAEDGVADNCCEELWLDGVQDGGEGHEIDDGGD